MEEGREEERRNYQRVRADRRRKERGGGGQQGEMEGWKIKRERDDGKID